MRAMILGHQQENALIELHGLHELNGLNELNRLNQMGRERSICRVGRIPFGTVFVAPMASLTPVPVSMPQGSAEEQIALMESWAQGALVQICCAPPRRSELSPAHVGLSLARNGN